MEALEKYRKAVSIAAYVERHLESLARTVELGEARTTFYNNVASDLKALYPEEDTEALARTIITEACRTAYIKMKDSENVRNHVQGR
jgi:hypothetical protein